MTDEGSHKEELILYWPEYNFVAYTEADRVSNFNTRYYFLFDIVVSNGFPSMPKREIVDMRSFWSEEPVMEKSLFSHWCQT